MLTMFVGILNSKVPVCEHITSTFASDYSLLTVEWVCMEVAN